MQEIQFLKGHLYRLGPQTNWHNEILLYVKRGEGGKKKKKLVFKRVLSQELFSSLSDYVRIETPTESNSIYSSLCDAEEIPLEDLPLYIDWKHKYPAFDKILKEM